MHAMNQNKKRYAVAVHDGQDLLLVHRKVTRSTKPVSTSRSDGVGSVFIDGRHSPRGGRGHRRPRVEPERPLQATRNRP